jgi:hypothetical protein
MHEAGNFSQLPPKASIVGIEEHFLRRPLMTLEFCPPTQTALFSASLGHFLEKIPSLAKTVP